MYFRLGKAVGYDNKLPAELLMLDSELLIKVLTKFGNVIID